MRSFAGCAGQRCMAASVLLLLGEQENLVKTIIDRAAALKPGQTTGVDDMGPVIDAASRDRIRKFVDDAVKGGAKLLLDGRTWQDPNSTVYKSNSILHAGFWMGPTILLHTSVNDPAMKEEIFGPVLSIFVCRTNQEAIDIENGNPYGNAACIYTSSGANAEWFTARFRAGMIGVNIGVPVPR